MTKPALFQASTITFRDLMSNGKHYEVPAYQRDYSWTEEQWEELWLDLESLAESGGQHYMGALVLQQHAADSFKIIDGQQRLATLSILVIASLHCLQGLVDGGVDAGQNRQRMELLRASFLGSKSPVTLRTTAKLTLNQANRRFYEGTLLELRQPASVSGLPATERPLWKCLVYFREKLNEKFAASKDGTGLARFISDLTATHLLFIQVVVEDEVSAYTVFETLNARGLELTAGDLLKNYLLSIVHRGGQGDLDKAQRQWQTIADKIEPARISTFLRHYMNSYHEFVRQERVFKTIRDEVTQPADVFVLLDRLEGAAILNEALEDPTHAFWDEYHAARDAVRQLKLYRVTQYRSLAFAVWRKLKSEDLEKVLRYVDVISFRYSVIGQGNPNRLERIYNEVAVKVEKGTLHGASDIKTALQPVYPSDEEFRESFAKHVAKAVGARKKLVRYILCTLERQLHNLDIDYETTAATIEHVLPEKPSPGWQGEFSRDVHERYVYRLGNYLLLEAKLNRQKAGNEGFAVKKAVYVQSQYPSTRDFEWEGWTPRAIEERQATMARAATAAWRLP